MLARYNRAGVVVEHSCLINNHYCGTTIFFGLSLFSFLTLFELAKVVAGAQGLNALRYSLSQWNLSLEFL